jgi:UPF0716 protein FxsA
MGIFLLAAFIGVPILEIAVFIKVGGLIGLWPTLAIVVLTAVAGTWALRAQGLATLARARTQIDRGELPTRELFDGACLLIAGALLLTPGFVTDFLGFLLFLPPVRDILRNLLAQHIKGRVETHVYVDGQEVHGTRRPGGRPRGRPGKGPVIEGDYDDVTDVDELPRSNRGGRGR